MENQNIKTRKDKTTAALLALFLGWMGAHRFYLGQGGLGIFYLILMGAGISFFLGFLDFLVLTFGSKEKFDAKYNSDLTMEKSAAYESKRKKKGAPRRTRTKAPLRNLPNSQFEELKQKGVKLFKDNDLEEAIEVFEEAIELDDMDIAVHFNLACSYSLNEDKNRGYYHLNRAVELGFNDYDRILEHDALAYLRIQENWEEFRLSGFRSNLKSLGEGSQNNLLDELKRLDKMKDEGYLSKDEFRVKKEELLRLKDEK